MKKKLMSLLLAASVVLSMPATLFAAETTPAENPISPVTIDGDMEIAPASVDSANVGVSRISNTSGSVSAHAGFDIKANKATCTITLQEKYNGSWRTATGIPVKSYIKNVYNAYTITASKTFTLAKGKVYRAKVTFTDTNSKGTFSKTYYSSSF